MMNLFLVEDERWALEELKALFKRYEPQHLVHAFENGEDALAAAKSVVPHLVLTDITMPGMDGLELLNKIGRSHPEAKGIILSVHDDFAYAQRGMQTGVTDYLLKPVRKETLYRAVDRMLARIEEESRSRSDRAEWSLLQRLLSADALERGERAAAEPQRMFMALLLLGNFASPLTWKDAGLDASDILAHFGSGLNGESECHCVTIDCRRRVLLLPADNEASALSIKTKLQILFNHMETRGILLHVSFGMKKESESLNRSFVRLGKQLEEHLRIGVPTWAAPDMKPTVPDIGEIWVKVRALQAQIKAGDMARGRDTVSRIVTWLQRKEVTQKQLTQFAIDLFYSLKFNLQSESKSRLHEDMSLLNEVINYEPITAWLTAAVFGMAGERESKEHKPKELVPVVINWIHANYQGDFSLQQFASEHHVSLGHLSRLFKSQTGYTFSDYVIGYRISKAKELLADGTSRPSEVGELVGYEDAKHFSHLFKRITGETPTAYAKRKMSE
ncbi:response regulator [Bacillus sp. FJAT-26390]|uniref:response regulator transcription factor n=1 Tax=Bacillus sp. FJAT-26390 TaxID=1743142 RepID=UPI0009E1A704|nr:response regulator [Bacillus sp. FJAT-26390]